MALLMPRVGKENQDLSKDSSGIASLEDFHGVVADDAQILEVCLRGMQQQPADPRAMHLDAEVIDVRIVLRQCADHFSGAEPDLEAARRDRRGRMPAVQVERAAREIRGRKRPQFGECALLRGGDAAGAQDEAANATLWMHGSKVCLI